MNPAVSSILICLVAMISQSSGQGQCPTIPTVSNFDFDKIGGIWYSIQESSPPRLPCLHYNLSHVGQVMTTQFLPYQVVLKATPKDPNDTTKGFNMISNLNLLDQANWAIFDTDYTSYCAIFTCKITAQENFQSITLWSRTQALSDDKVNKIKAKLDKYNIPYGSLQMMVQNSGCKYFDFSLSPIMTLIAPYLTPLANWIGSF